MRRKLAILLIAALFICACSYPKDSTDTVSKSGFFFDTIIRITLYDPSLEYAIDHCLEMAETYEGYFSDTIDDSDVALINSHPGEYVAVHEETAELIDIGLKYCGKFDGRFDITVGKLSSLWRFEEDEDFTPPSDEAVASALSGVDYRKVRIDGNTVCLDSDDCAIDLGGIAKGYIADRMKDYLISEGITAGLINLGGNVLVLGDKDGRPYTIGIQKPFSEDGTPAVAVDITDCSVVTSGTYQRYAKTGGRLYHHIIDLSTGFPADNGLSSVSIICEDSVDADALSTAIFLSGIKKGMSYIEDTPDVEAAFITTEGEIIYSSGMGDSIPYKEY